MATFDEVLAEFKESEEAGSVLPLVEDVKLRNGVIAWKSMRVERVADGDCTLEDRTARWEWLWTQVKVDVAMFGRVSGYNYQETGLMFERLKGLRYIYPDGTVNTYAQQLLNSILAAMLAKGRKGMKAAAK